MRELVKRLHSSHFFTLSGGVLVANLLSFISMPLLARFYSSSSFGLLAIYLALSTMVGMFSTLRLEQAIPLSQDPKDEGTLIGLSLLSSLAVSLLLFGVLVGSGRLELWQPSPFWFHFAVVCSVSCFLMGAIHTFTQVRIRSGQLKILAIRHVLEKLTIIVVAMIFVYFLNDEFGLIYAQAAGFAVSAFFLMGIKFRWARSMFSYAEGLRVFLLNRDFPTKNFVSTGLSTAAHQAPSLIFSVFFPISSIGLWSLAQRLLESPNFLVGSSWSILFYRKLLGADDAQKKKYLRRLMIGSIVTLALGALLIGAFARNLVVLIFGPPMDGVTPYLKVLLPLAVARLTFILLQPFFLATRKLGRELYVSLLLFLSTTVTIGLGLFRAQDLLSVVKLMALGNLLAYCAALVLLWESDGG